jgi:hypothetical protein
MRSWVVTAGALAIAGVAATGSNAQAPGQPAAAPPAAPAQAGRPANLCQELVAFLRQPKPAPAQANPAQTTAVQAPPQGAQPAQPSGQGAPTTSGLSGPIPHGPGQAAAPGAAPSSATAAAPAGSTSGQVTLDEAEGLARANDVKGCRAATQRLRLAGAPLPPALLALGALDPKYLEASAAPSDPK